MTEDYINLIARCSVPKTLTLDEVETDTDSDKTLRGVRAAIKLNKWHYDLVKAFKPVKDELTVTSKGVVLRGTRIVLPQSLQQRAVDIAHATHLGLSKTKALIREKVWFPKMDKMIQTTIKQCPTHINQSKAPKCQRVPGKNCTWIFTVHSHPVNIYWL